MSRSASAALAAVAAVAVLAACGGAPGPPSGATFTSAPVVPPIARDRIYFVMTDRYADGDPSNDRGGKTGGIDATGYDPTSPAYFHGGDFKGLTAHLERIKALGFTAVWVTPPFGQNTVQGTSAAYHGYWIDDFTHVDPHFGTDAEFAAFVDSAHRLGLKVILDVVVNHTGDVIQLSSPAYSARQYRDCHGKRFDPQAYVGGDSFPCLSATKMPNPPTVAPAIKRPAWLNDPLNYHDRGDLSLSGPCDDTCLTQGDFFGLDDLFTEKPNVVAGLAALYAGWVRRDHLDGFRVDTARHVNNGFFQQWVPQILAAGGPGFQIFGEAAMSDPVQLSTYVRERGLPNVLDFPFQDRAVHFAAGALDASELGKLLRDDDYFRTGSGTVPSPVTFLGNHDMGRAAFQVAQAGVGTGSELLSRLFFAYDLLYLLRGAPAVFSGDEVGMIGSGGDQAARQDMFPTKVAEWRTEPRVGWPPIGASSSFDVTEHPLEQHLRELSALRERDAALDGGWTIVRHAQGPILVVSRIDPVAKRETVVAFNAGDAPADVTITAATTATDWVSLRGGPGAHSSGTGRLTLHVDPLVATVLRAKDAISAGGAPRSVALRIGTDDATTLPLATAAVPGEAPVSVAFAIRVGGHWRLLADDPEPPYRALIDAAALHVKSGTRVYLAAVARGLSGATRPSQVLKYRVP